MSAAPAYERSVSLVWTITKTGPAVHDPFADVSVRLALAKKQPLGDLLEPQLFVVFLSNCGAKAAEDWSDYDIGLKLHRLDVRWRHGQHFVLRFNSYIN